MKQPGREESDFELKEEENCFKFRGLFLFLLHIAVTMLFLMASSLLAIVYWIGVSIWYGTRHRQFLPLAIPAFVIALSFLFGTVGYAGGFANVHTYGLVNESHESRTEGPLPPGQSRVFGRSGKALFLYGPNNQSVRMMGHLFGRMKGTYNGPYPGKEMARARIIESDTIVSTKEVRSGKFRIGEKTVRDLKNLSGKMFCVSNHLHELVKKA